MSDPLDLVPCRNPASAEHIRRIAGPVSDAALAALLALGATFEEMALAAAYMRGEGDRVGSRHYILTRRIKRAFDILARDEEERDAPVGGPRPAVYVPL